MRKSDALKRASLLAVTRNITVFVDRRENENLPKGSPRTYRPNVSGDYVKGWEPAYIAFSDGDIAPL